MIPMLLSLAMIPPDAPIEVGKRAPDVALTDMSGKTVRLSGFSGKKLILFNWASW